jgi:hypothetical protein
MLEMLAGQAASSLFGGLGKGIGDAIGGGGPFMGGDAQSGAYGVSLEKGGTVYNFGGSNTNATRTERTTEAATPTPMGSDWPAEPAPMQAGASPWMLAALALVAFGMWKRSKA